MLRQRALLNAVSAFGEYFVRMLVNFFLTPFLDKHLGVSQFGLWKVLQRFITFMASADGRPTQALKWLMANKQSAEGDEKREHFASAVGVWLAFIPLVALIGAVLLWMAPDWLGPHRLLEIPKDAPAAVAETSYNGKMAEADTDRDREKLKDAYDLLTSPGALERFDDMVRIALGLLVLHFLVQGFGQLPGSTLQGNNLAWINFLIRIGVHLLVAGLTIWLILSGGDIRALALAQLSGGILTGLACHAVARRLFSWFRMSRPRLKGMKGFFSLSKWYFAWTFVNKILLNADLLVLGFFLGTAAVTPYFYTGFAS
ncbi:MAG: oligosaccharide flippase family protein, partial [Verrucomicrobiota bacterium]